MQSKKLGGSRNVSGNLKFCSQHENYQVKYWRDRFEYWLPLILSILFFIISTILAHIYFTSSVTKSIELSEESLNDAINATFWLTSPVTLLINDTVDEKEGRWNFNVTNTHPLKGTGTIYLYRLEINPDKPHMANHTGLRPGESRVFSLTFKSKKENVTFSQSKNRYGGCDFVPPSVATYFVNDHVSISAKITCDNCPSQGIIRRLPDFEVVDFTFTLRNNCIINTSIPTYNWTDFKLEDIQK